MARRGIALVFTFLGLAVLVSIAAFVPTSCSSLPMTKDGCRPAARRMSVTIDDVVVLPWVPATATDRDCAQIDASMPDR